MLSWVVCWLHGHVVCDGSVMVGKMGGGWLGGMGGGMEWEITHHDHYARINSAQSIPV